MAITDFFEQMKPKATNGERVVKLAKERDFLCDRISETEAEAAVGFEKVFDNFD